MSLCYESLGDGEGDGDCEYGAPLSPLRCLPRRDVRGSAANFGHTQPQLEGYD
jgi:hypothetical protein